MTNFLRLGNILSQTFDFSFESLVVGNGWLDIMCQVSNLRFSLSDLGSDSMSLFWNFSTFSNFVSVLIFHHFEFISQRSNDALLTGKLCIKVTLECSYTWVHGFSSSLQVIKVSLEGAEVSVIEFVWLDLSTVGGNDAVSVSLAELVDLIWSLVFTLDSGIFCLLSFFTLNSVLFVKAERVRMMGSSSCGSLSMSLFFSGWNHSHWWLGAIWRALSGIMVERRLSKMHLMWVLITLWWKPMMSNQKFFLHVL